jgi:transcriptional antiterminator RfaH
MTEHREEIQPGMWIAATTHHFKEALATENLRAQGFQTYCPMIRKRVRHARRQSEVLRPLFPGYVFIRFDPLSTQWRPILSTIGVRTLIRFGDKIGVLPPNFVENLRIREDHGAIPLPRARDHYAAGERVRMREGPFDGVIATVLAAEDKDRLLVLMDLLKRGVRVKVSIDDVVPV